MKALILTHRIADFTWLAKELARRGHEVGAVVLSETGDVPPSPGAPADPEEAGAMSKARPDPFDTSPAGLAAEVADAAAVVFRCLEPGEPPSAALADLRRRAGPSPLAIAVGECRDPVWAESVLEVGFDDVLVADSGEEARPRIHALENLARRMDRRSALGEAPETLAVAQDQLRLLEELSPDLIWSFLGPEEPEYVNPQWTEFLGLNLEDLAPEGWVRFVHPDDLPGLRAAWKDCWEKGRLIRQELRLKVRDGSYRWFWVRSSALRRMAGGRMRLIGVISDIDERRRTEASLRESEERFRDLANNMSQMAWMAEPDGTRFWSNRRWFDYTGLTSDESSEDGWRSVHHPEHLDRVLRGLDEAFRTGTPWEDTFPLRGKDGTYRWFLTRVDPICDAEGRIIRWLGTNTDITGNREAAQRAEGSRAQLEAVLQSVQDGIVVVDKQGGLVFANQAQARIAALGSAEELGRDPMSYLAVFEFHEMDGTLVPQERWPLARILHGETLTQLLLRGRRRDTGQEWYFSLSGQPIRDEHGDPVLAVLVTRDVTAPHQAEDDVRRERGLLERLIDRLPVMVTIFDTRNGAFRLNEEFRRTLGWTEEDAARDDLFALAFPDPVTRERVRDLMATSAPGWHDLEATAKDGGIVPCSWAYLLTDGIRVGIGIDLRDRRRAEQEVRDAQKLLRSLMDNSPGVILFKDLDGRYIDVNRSLEQILETPSDRLRGKTDYDILPAELADRYREYDVQVMDERKPIAVEELTRFPRGTFHLLDVRFPLLDGSGRLYGVGTISYDITERKKAEEAVRESEERLRQLVHANPVGMILAEFTGRIFETNDAFLATIGCSREDFEQGRVRWDAITPPEWLPVDEAHMREALERGATSPYEKELLRRDGTRVPVLVGFGLLGELRGLETRSAAFVFDLSREKAIQEALRRSEESFKAIAESLPGLVWGSTPEGRFDYLNARWSEYTGLPLEQVLRSRAGDAIAPEDIAEHARLWRQALGTGNAFQAEARLRRSDGEYRWFLMKALPVRDARGRIVRWVGTAIDVEDQKRAEQGLQRTKRDLEALVRERTAELERKALELERSNAELQRFAYIASHDLQEPLRIVVSYAQLLAKRYGECVGPEAEDYIDFMSAAARRMRLLIDDLLAYSRVESGAPRFASVDVAELLRSAIAGLRSEIRQDHAEIVIGPVPVLEADADLLRQVFEHLLGNALKFRSAEPPRIAISATREGDSWIFAVRDNGIGVPKEFQGAIFEPFRRLHAWDEYPGTGIGLAICRRIVESHGGRIWVEPAEGGGTTFRFALPARQEQEAADIAAATERRAG